jgi:hypothetical protein
MDTDSLRSNTLNRFLESDLGAISRDAIKADLVDKIVYDDPAVFRRLRIDQVNRDFVTACAASFNGANAEDIRLLMELLERTSKETSEELEIEEINDATNDLNEEESGSAEEEKMYEPLECFVLNNDCVFHCSDSY